MNDIEVDFVLVRGPENVSRRLHVTVPADGTPVTIGRALHCGAVLDPWLVFASQVQCSLLCMPPEQGQGEERPNTATLSASAPARSHPGTAEEDGTVAPVAPEGPTALTPDRPPLMPTSTAGSSADSSDHRPAATGTPRPPAAPRLFLTDMCSSNGTFVRGVRVGPTDAAALQDGDDCIFGGMRDVAVGEALPPDAFAGPELVVWRVAFGGGKAGGQPPTAYPFEATPVLLPTAEVLQREEREVLSTALRSLRREPARWLGGQRGEEASTPAALSPASGGEATPASPVVPVQLFSGQTPATELRRPLKHEDGGLVEAADSPDEACELEDDGQRRSGTVAARISADPTAAPTPAPAPDPGQHEGGEPQAPPPPDTDFFLLLNTLESPPNAPAVHVPPPSVFFHAVRVGRHTFHVPIGSLLGVYMAELAAASQGDVNNRPDSDQGGEEIACQEGAKVTHKRRREGGAAVAKRSKTEEPPSRPLPKPVHAIHFTASHWKWVMDNPNGGTGGRGGLASSAFHALLPVTSVESILVCRERLGVSVELRSGCQVPLIRPGVLDGAPENRWLVWMLEDCQLNLTSGCVSDGEERSVSATGAGAAADTKRAEKKKQKGAVAEAAVDFGSATTGSLHEKFDAWIAHLTAFYAPYKVPAPIAVDAEVFDKLFAPEMMVEE